MNRSALSLALLFEPVLKSAPTSLGYADASR